MSAKAGSELAPLRAALSGDSRIAAWQIRSVTRSGLQSYLVKTQLETERHTTGDTHEVTVFARQGEMMGRATVSLGAGDGRAVGQRVEEAAYMASLGGDAPWSLPSSGTWPTVETFDPALGPDRIRGTSKDLIERWRAAVAPLPFVRPSSMELFCGEERTRIENSLGLVSEFASSRASLLTLLLAAGEHPSERHSWDERRRVSDLDVASIVGRVAMEARDLTTATVAPSGDYAVVIDASEIAALLDPLRAQTSAESLYQKSSRLEVGKPLPIDGEGGEPLTVSSNALLPYGLASYAFDANGVAGQRVDLIRDNMFVRPWATRQFAQYMKVDATGSFANWELPAGRTSVEDLLAGGRVLHVRSFSWLTPDQARGNFGSEIRVGYLYENGTRRPVKGGTVSGNVFKALGSARYSRDLVFLGDYSGPAAVRFENLNVSGA